MDALLDDHDLRLGRRDLARHVGAHFAWASEWERGPSRNEVEGRKAACQGAAEDDATFWTGRVEARGGWFGKTVLERQRTFERLAHIR